MIPAAQVPVHTSYVTVIWARKDLLSQLSDCLRVRGGFAFLGMPGYILVPFPIANSARERVSGSPQRTVPHS